MSRAALSADDEPVDALEVQRGQRSQKRLRAYKTNCCSGRAQVIGATNPPIVFDRSAQPNVWQARD
jgi:hypothetical protein